MKFKKEFCICLCGTPNLSHFGTNNLVYNVKKIYLEILKDNVEFLEFLVKNVLHNFLSPRCYVKAKLLLFQLSPDTKRIHINLGSMPQFSSMLLEILASKLWKYS
jgi:hypothetical protein